MNAAVKQPAKAERVVPLAKVRTLPTIRQWAESRPAVDPVLVARLRGAK